jgi:hypothetical protein
LVFIHGLQECLGFAAGAWFHQQRVLIGLLLPHSLNLLEKFHFVAWSGPVILIFNKG